MSYTPPSSFPAGLPFQPPASPYTPPTSQPISLEFGDDVPPSTLANVTASDQSSYGTPMVAFSIRDVAPSGISSTAYGTPTLFNSRQYVDLDTHGVAEGDFGTLVTYLRNQYVYPMIVQQSGEFGDFGARLTDPFELSFEPPVSYVPPTVFPAELAFLTGGSDTILPTGIYTGAVGTPAINLYNQLILPGGIAPNPQTGPDSLQEAPPPTVFLRTRYLTPAGIAPPLSAFGTLHISLYYQFLDLAGNGIASAAYGTALVADRVRYLYPAFIYSQAFGTANISRTLYILPSGFSSEFIPSNHELEDFSNKIRTHSGSADPARYGVPDVRNTREFIYADTSAWVGAQVNYPRVYNQDQGLTVGAYQDTNGDPAGYGAPFVENRNRVVATQGHQSSRFSFYAANVYNNAWAIQPLGMDTLWGTARVEHSIRTVFPEGLDAFYSGPYGVIYNSARVVQPSGFTAEALGAPAILNLNRTVSQYFPYEGGVFGTAFVAYSIRYLGPFALLDVPAAFPEVRYNPYPITPIGIDSYATGGHDLHIHINEILPKSVNVPVVPRVGDAYIHNRNVEVTPYAYDQSSYGRPTIQNRDQYITVSVGDTALFGLAYIADSHRTLTPQPFSSLHVSTFAQVRNLIPDPPGQQNVYPDGITIGLDDAIGIPSVRYQTVFTIGLSGIAFGSHVVRTNSISPRWDFDDYVGTPTLVGTRWIYPTRIPSIEGQGESDVFSSKPRLSPHTIYAPAADQATAQALINHPGAQPHIIDPDLWLSAPYHFGVNRVEHRNRSVYQTNAFPTGETFGTPTVTLRKRYIYPASVRGFRAGVASLNGPQYIDGVTLSDTLEVGAHNLVDPTYVPTIVPVGIVPLVIANQEITLKNRQVYPAGFDATLWGTPMMGWTRRPEMQGYVATLWGVPRVEYKNRFVHPVGTEMFHSSDELSGFNDRMRVTLRNPAISPVGFLATMFGVSTVAQRIRTLLPIGADTATIGPYTSVHAVSTLAPMGFDSSVIGDIDEWESGKIKAHGDDSAVFGTPCIDRRVLITGGDTSTIGAPRVGQVIYTTGMPEVGFAGPTLTDQYGCNVRYVAVPTLPTGGVGQPLTYDPIILLVVGIPEGNFGTFINVYDPGTGSTPEEEM